MRILGIALLAACAGTRSGLPGSERLVDLDGIDEMIECQYLHDAFPPRMIACDMTNQLTVFNEDVATCVSDHTTLSMNDPDCAATVAQAEECEADLYAEPDAYFCEATPEPPITCLPLHTADCTH